MEGFGCVICSTPNGRGIHAYAEFLGREVSGYRLVMPGRGCKSFLIWEMVGILGKLSTLLRAKELIFVNTRVSPFLWFILSWHKVSVVVHDLMDTLEERDYRFNSVDSVEYIKRMVNGYLLRVSIERAGCVLCNSRHTRNELCRWLGEKYKESCILRPPLSFRQFLNTVDTVKQSKNESELEEGEIRILAIAGMSRNKALGDYFELHGILKREMKKGMRMVIYGVDLQRVEERIRDYAFKERDSLVLRYKGDSSELLSEYLTCDMLISLSSDEGFGMPVADASAFGIDSVVRDICAFREQRNEKLGKGRIVLVKDVKECAIEASRISVSRNLNGAKSSEKEWAKRKMLYTECVREELETSRRIFTSHRDRL